MEVSHSRRRRRRAQAVGLQRQVRRTLWCVSGLLVLTTGVDAGKSEVAWVLDPVDDLGPTAMVVDSVGAIVVTECSGGGEAFHVTKFSVRGDQLWKRTFRSEDLTGDDVEGTVCATAITTDAGQNLFVAGTHSRVATSRDSNVFVARLAESGLLVWTQTLGTPFTDSVTSLTANDAMESLFVGGFSAGDLSLGRSSASNCEAPPSSRDNSGVCDDGFVVSLALKDGAVRWIQSVVSQRDQQGRRLGETRVFDLVATDKMLVVVGETRGEMSGSSSSGPRHHAGDVFVRRLAMETGTALWTSQLTSAGDSSEFCRQRMTSSSLTDVYDDRVLVRGRCGLTILGRGSSDLAVVGSTNGLLSTSPSQREAYTRICGATTTSPCVQLFLARLDVDTGAVRWIQQLVHATHTTAEGIVAIQDGAANDVVVLAAADAGFFVGSESMEQIAVIRASGEDGTVQWTTELGLAGEDHAVALAVADSNVNSVVALGHGSQDKSRRGRSSTQAWIRRMQTGDGIAVPVCIDSVGFDKTHEPQLNVTRGGEDLPQWRLVQLPLRRNATTRCADSLATMRYRYSVDLNTTQSSGSSGVVHFSASQADASIALSVPWSAISLRVWLEPITEYVMVDTSSNEWMLKLDKRTETTQRDANDSGAADGRLWQQLTWISLVVAIVVTTLVVVGGRLVCWRSSEWSWRRAKVFQYTTLRLRRSKPTESSRGPVAEETEELRSHLQEIQQLNDSLDGLLLVQAGVSSTSEVDSRSPAAVVPSSPSRPKSSGWRRSFRRVLPSPHKKR